MIKTLIIKEVQSSLHNYKFVVLLVFSLIFIPLSIYLSYSNYEYDKNIYDRAQSNYLDRVKGEIDNGLIVEGFRPPNIESIFTQSLTDLIPFKVSISSSRLLKFENKENSSDSISLLWGVLDLSGVINLFIILFTLFFSYNLVNKEIENGTMKLLLTNSFPRHYIIISKVIGNYLVILIPVLISYIIGILILFFISGFSIYSTSFVYTIVFFFLFTCLNILVYFNLGVLFSTLFKRASVSIIMLLFFWVIANFVFPAISPVISKIVAPIKSDVVFDLEVKTINNDYNTLVEKKQFTLFNKMIGKNNLFVSPEYYGSELFRQYQKEASNIYNKVITQRNLKIKNLETEKDNKIILQNRIAQNFSRISPSICYQNIVSEITKNGYSQVTNFTQQAKKFQSIVCDSIFNSFLYVNYIDNKGNYVVSGVIKEGIDLKKVSVPKFNYINLNYAKIINEIWLDVVIVFFYGIAFFIISYFKFIRMNIV